MPSWLLLLLVFLQLLSLSLHTDTPLREMGF